MQIVQKWVIMLLDWPWVEMNIWIEYWEKSKEPSKNTHAQIREQAHWVPPDPKTVHKRFCQGREDANRYANSLQEQGYHVIIKQDNGGY